MAAVRTESMIASFVIATTNDDPTDVKKEDIKPSVSRAGSVARPNGSRASSLANGSRASTEQPLFRPRDSQSATPQADPGDETENGIGDETEYAELAEGDDELLEQAAQQAEVAASQAQSQSQAQSRPSWNLFD